MPKSHDCWPERQNCGPEKKEAPQRCAQPLFAAPPQFRGALCKGKGDSSQTATYMTGKRQADKFERHFLAKALTMEYQILSNLLRSLCLILVLRSKSASAIRT